VSYQEALEVALCYGWIDGQKKSFDEESWLQKFTPRGPKSIWSKINRAKALELIEKGRMQAAGLAAIEKAKENGRWEAAYDSHRTAAPPGDFETALNNSHKAKSFCATLNSQNRFAILFRIQTAKKPETRQKRIDQFIRMLEKHEKLYPQSARGAGLKKALRFAVQRAAAQLSGRLLRCCTRWMVTVLVWSSMS
jgi:uncharacterized protein YdeI (YjbR/CyaY-like superfamily)